MTDIRLAAVELELGLGHRTDPDDPYDQMPASDRPDIDLQPAGSPDALEEALGPRLRDPDDLDRTWLGDDEPEG